MEDFTPSSWNLSDRAALLETLISRLHEFVIVLASPTGRFMTWHAGVEQLFGYALDEFIGQPTDILFPLAERLLGAGRRELEQAVEKGCASDTRPLLTKAGQKVMVEGVTIALRSENGELQGFGKVLRDVTKQKTAQDNLLALTRALDQSAVIVRRWDGIIDHWTAGCERLYGWSAEEARGRSCQILLKTEFPQSLDQIQQELLTSGTWNGELRHVRKNGTQVAVSAHWALLVDEAQEPLSIIEGHSDISARILVQRELETANRKLQTLTLELERSNQELEEFARIASHDLSAPITSTRWIAEMLKRRHAPQLDEDGRKCIDQIMQGLDRMAQLVEAILAHAQVGTTAISSSAYTHSEDALGVAIESLRSHINASGARIRYDSLPAVEVKPQALIQLFQNLLSNAIKYRKKGVPPEITIRADWKAPMWTISVEDNGIGVEPEWSERIFQAMQRRDDQGIGGSGIGLATCKKIVNRAGGSIWVESEPGVGSIFYCTLLGPDPQSQEQLHAAPAASAPAAETVV